MDFDKLHALGLRKSENNLSSPSEVARARLGVAMEKLLEADSILREISEINPSNRKSYYEKAYKIYKERKNRAYFFHEELFGEPFWDIILDLYIAHFKNSNSSTKSVCIASGAPTTTALRCLDRLEKLGYIIRRHDPADRRMTYVELSNGGIQAVEKYLENIVDD